MNGAISEEERSELGWSETARHLTTFPRARKARRCTTGANEAGCHRTIPAGDRYARTALPPLAEPFCTDTWVHLSECEACSNWWGRTFPEVTP